MSLDKYNTYSSPILSYILNMEKESPKVLDVGCWTGALGHHLKESGFAGLIDGVDMNNDALVVAKDNGYRRVHLLDLNQLSSDQIDFDDGYDIIILGDVLEHTIDPKKTLMFFTKLLGQNGRVALSVPNIGFIYYRLAHLFGLWEYKETGVMDATHLRFFTLKTSRELIGSCGLDIIEENPYIGISNWPALVRDSMRFLASKLPKLFAMQHTFLAKKKEAVPVT